MTDTTISLAARLAANLIVDAINLAKPGARLAGKIGDRLLGGSPFNEREAQRFLLDGADALNEAEAQVDSLDPWWADGGPTEWIEPQLHTGSFQDCPTCNPTAPEFNTMPNWQAPKSSAPVAPKPTDVAGSAPGSTPAPPLSGVGPGHLNQPVERAVALFDKFVIDHTDSALHAHFADNDDNAAERIRRAIRRIGTLEQPVGVGVAEPGADGTQLVDDLARVLCEESFPEDGPQLWEEILMDSTRDSWRRHARAVLKNFNVTPK